MPRNAPCHPVLNRYCDGHLGLEDAAATKHLPGDYSVIPPGLSRDLSRLAGFRNLLVHEYTALDLDRVFRTLQEDIQVLEKFREYVVDFIRETEI